MAAEVEEAVLNTDVFDAEEFFPEADQGAFDVVPGFDEVRVELRAGELGAAARSLGDALFGFGDETGKVEA